MEYNTARDHLILPEYGRHVQKMVEHATNIKDKEERNKCVNAIINFMGQMNPQLRDLKEFNHKLWDHLFIMSQFQLDADCPYPLPEIKKLEEKPDKMDYPKNKIKFPFYGAALENMIRYAVDQKDGRDKEIMTGMIANNMKKSYLLFNKPVSLSYVANEGKIAKFFEETRNITSYAKQVKKLYPNVLSRRPKKLL